MHERVPVPAVTYTLMALNGGVWLLTAMFRDAPLGFDLRLMLDWGALYGPYVLDGQWARIPMSMFLHVSFDHLFGNMLVLWLAGTTAERLFGPLTFGVLYAVCGLVGAVASLVVHPGLVHVGASAAVLGTLAAVLGFLLRRPVARKSVRFLGALWTFGLALLAYSAFTAALQRFGAYLNVGHAAHAAGVVCGFVAGYLAARPATESDDGKRRRAAVPIAAVGALLIAAGMTLVPHVDDALDLILDVRDVEAEIQSAWRNQPENRYIRVGPRPMIGPVGKYPALGQASPKKVLPVYRSLLARADAMKHVDPRLEEPMDELRAYLQARVTQLEGMGGGRLPGA